MCTADGINTHFLHNCKLASDSLAVYGSTECTECMMFTGTVDFYISAIQKETFIRVKGNCPETKAFITGINGSFVFYNFTMYGVQIR